MKKMMILSFAVLAMVFVSCTTSTEEVVTESESIDTTDVLTDEETGVDVVTDSVVADSVVIAE